MLLLINYVKPVFYSKNSNELRIFYYCWLLSAGCSSLVLFVSALARYGTQIVSGQNFVSDINDKILWMACLCQATRLAGMAECSGSAAKAFVIQPAGDGELRLLL
jgi:hypothetical protein